MTTLSYILGVDPGLSGGFALVLAHTDAVHISQPRVITYAMPTHILKQAGKKRTNVNAIELAAWLDAHRNLIKHAYVEQVSSRPRQAGQFQFGVNTGLIHGMLYANIIPWSFVPPQQWKMHFGIKRINDETKADKKSEARAIATARWPDHAKAFSRVMDDGVAEASLIALYGVHFESTK